jgi:DNA-binding transcriptional ArsR family regulator
MQDVEVIESAEAAAAALDPVRARLLGELAVPASAAGLAARVGITRQKVNYHLKALEAHGLVELAEERTWGGITERLLRRSARHLVVDPDVLPGDAIAPEDIADRLSGAYLVAVNARAVSEVGAILGGATGRTRVPTLTLDTVIGFRSAQDRASFADDLQSAVAALVARYHHDRGRPHRLSVTSYPRPQEHT